MIIYESTVIYSRKEISAVEINSLDSAVPFIRDFFNKNIEDPTKEHVVVCVLNNKNFAVNTKILNIGVVNQCLVKPSDIIKHVLLNNGTGFFIAHNHPSGDPIPSSSDNKVTRIVNEAAKLMDLQFVDHIILGEVENDPAGLGYYSFRDAGIM